ncbi:MAG: hypothetical protein NT070_03655 [Cyanobacteria bacterium]|nr:hypothetical protein [Cyanobacteriota bacterium]
MSCQWSRDRNESFEKSIRILNDSFGGVKEIRVLGCEPYFEQQVDREFKRYAISGSSFHAMALIRMLPCVGTVVNGANQVHYAGSALDKIYFALKQLETLPGGNIMSLGSSPETWMGSRPAIAPLSFKNL